MKIKSPTDFRVGLMFIGFGLFALLVAQFNYKTGSALRMGPGYFPSVLGGILTMLGMIVLFNSLVLTGPKVSSFHFRPLLFIVASCLAFAYLLKPLGMMLSIVALVFIGAAGGHEFKWKEVVILAVVMIAFSVFVFVKGLALPFPIWPAFMK